MVIRASQLIKRLKIKAVAYWDQTDWPVRTVFILAILALCSLAASGISRLMPARQIVEQKQSFDTQNSAVAEYNNIPSYYIRRHLDGTYIDPKNADYYPVAVMIDNDPNARPQAGLAHAQIVYEALMEGAITRFMAIFSESKNTPEEIGPVRSARPYFIDWAQGYDALYAHVGGSPEALGELKNVSMYNINEFYQGKYFWRSSGREAPHNVLSAAKNFYFYLDNLNIRSADYRSWQYKDEAPIHERGGQNIDINFNNPLFAVSWQYDKEENQYRRLMAGAPHNDADGTPIAAKNIIIMKVPTQIIDTELRRRMQNIGEGKTWYCLNGICQTGTWKKTSATEREVIYDDNNEEVKFNAGTTWIEVVQYDGNITMQNQE